MKKVLNILIIVTLLTTVSCDNDDSVVELNPNSVTDCSLSYTVDLDQYFVGICLDGTNSALPGETITYASKATPNFTEIIWTVESGSMEVMGIVTSVENNVENGRLKSIATIRFNSDFSGGSLKAEAINNDGE